MRHFVRAVCAMLAVAAGVAHAGFDDEFDQKTWQELEIQLPKAPEPADLMPFYVSASTENRFAVDARSLSVGQDGVVRYTLVITSPQGARNVSYEGMRCETRERRHYASGRRNGDWARARNADWVRLRDSEVNRHYAELFFSYLCPGGVLARDPAEIVGLFKRGGYTPGSSF